MEVWKDIEFYEGIYSVSNLGNVKSHLFKVSKSLKLEDVKGYKRVSLSKNGNIKRFYVHRLVACAFLENKPNKKVVNHLDSDTSNNNVNNLEWVSHRENITHAHKDKTTGVYKLKGSKTYQVKIYFKGKHLYLGSSTSYLKAKKIYNDFNKQNNINNKYINN